MKTLEESGVKRKKVVDNNLKYLINMDRNDRKKNIMIFGVPELDEDDEFMIEDEYPENDDEVCEKLFRFIGADEEYDKIDEVFRIGKKGEKPRPIKVKLSKKDAAAEIVRNAGELKKLRNHKIYIKPDKTAAEREEFQRIGKKKTELLEQYPTAENTPPRVVLEKGILKLDGAKIDEYKSPQTLF